MGTIKQGILGGFSGKVGTVIGSCWKGKSCMRSIAQNVKNPRTEAQMAQRMRFKATTDFLSSMLPFIHEGYKNHAKNMTEYNAAQSYLLNNAVRGEYPDIALNYEMVLVSRGKLQKALGARAESDSGSIKITWEDNSDMPGASADDIAMAVVYDTEAKEAFYTTRGEGRRRGNPREVINIPARAAGHSLMTYLSFVSKDGRIVSDSVFCGEVHI